MSSSHAQQGRTHAPQAFQRCLDVCSLQQRPRQRWQQGGQSGAVCNLLNALEVVLQVRLRVLQQGTGGEGEVEGPSRATAVEAMQPVTCIGSAPTHLAR